MVEHVCSLEDAVWDLEAVRVETEVRLLRQLSDPQGKA